MQDTDVHLYMTWLLGEARVRDVMIPALGDRKGMLAKRTASGQSVGSCMYAFAVRVVEAHKKGEALNWPEELLGCQEEKNALSWEVFQQQLQHAAGSPKVVERLREMSDRAVYRPVQSMQKELPRYEFSMQDVCGDDLLRVVMNAAWNTLIIVYPGQTQSGWRASVWYISRATGSTMAPEQAKQLLPAHLQQVRQTNFVLACSTNTRTMLYWYDVFTSCCIMSRNPDAESTDVQQQIECVRKMIGTSIRETGRNQMIWRPATSEVDLLKSYFGSWRQRKLQTIKT